MTITIPPGATAGVTADGLESLASLDDICALPLQETVERAAAALGHLVHDTGFVPLEVLPLLQTAHEARGWYVALQQGVGDDASSCSLQVFVWPAGSWTQIHDHSSWGVFCCVAGRVQEERYERLDDGTVLEHARLRMMWQRAWSGDDEASTVLPYDDGIHRVGNPYATGAISVHLYGPRVGECQWPRSSPHWRPGFLPADGHRNSPPAANENPRYSLTRDTTPFPAVASVSR